MERPAVNSAIVSVNLRPLKKKIFKDPVVITLRHSVVSMLPIKRPTPISAYICNPLQLSVTYMKAPSKFDSKNCVVHHDNTTIELLMPEHFLCPLQSCTTENPTSDTFETTKIKLSHMPAKQQS